MGGRVSRAKMRSLGGELSRFGTCIVYYRICGGISRSRNGMGFFYFLDKESLPNGRRRLGLRAGNKAGCWDLEIKILKVVLNAGYFFRREERKRMD